MNVVQMEIGSYPVATNLGNVPCGHMQRTYTLRRVSFDGQSTYDVSCECGMTQVRLSYKQKRNR